MHITVPSGYQVLGSGLDSHQAAGDKIVYSFHFDHPSFPGSIAIVRDPGTKVTSEGVTSTLYFRGDEKGMAQQYGEQIGQMMTFFTGDFGLPPYANLTVVETENGAPNGYAAPGMIFLNPHAIGRQVGAKLLANQISRQWWEVLVSPATRNHLWLTNGMAAYSELLWTEHTAGPGALESQFRDDAVEALTIDNVPVIQAARMEDYSPELWALTGSKGAAVLHMLRFVIGDQAFMQTLKEFATRYSWKSATTEDFKNVAQDVSKQDLGYFFIQWIESSGRTRIQAGIHHFPHAERLPRDGQSGAGPGYVPHAGGSEDRDRGQSRREARGSGRHFFGIQRGTVSASPRTWSSTRTAGYCASTTRCARRWPSAAASSSWK